VINTLHLYCHYIRLSIRGQMQYRASFIMQAIGHLLMTGLEAMGIWVLFHRFGHLQSWSLPEVAVFYGIVNIAFSLCDASSRGFDVFAEMVKSGDFDRVLLRPRSSVLQLAGQELTLRRIGRTTQGVIVLIWGICALHLTLSCAKIALLLTAILGGACLFYGLIVLQATTAFWTIESLELFNILTYGGVETAQFPINIYRSWFQRFFTFVVPLACINYFPLHAFLGRVDPLGSTPLFQWLSPLLGVAFLLISLQVWKIGVRHYCSTGS